MHWSLTPIYNKNKKGMNIRGGSGLTISPQGDATVHIHRVLPPPYDKRLIKSVLTYLLLIFVNRNERRMRQFDEQREEERRREAIQQERRMQAMDSRLQNERVGLGHSI